MRITVVSYDGPLHQRLANPTDDELRDLIFSTGDAYWLAGSGDAELRFVDGRRTACLGMTKASPYGFRLLFKDESSEDMLVAVAGEDFEETVPVFTCGEYHDEPLALFFDELMTFRVVTEFCRSGALPADVRWRKWTDVMRADRE